MHVKISGASDDLIELDGDIVEEYDSYDTPTYLAFSEGTVVKLQYCETGIWRVTVEREGAATATYTQRGVDYDAPDPEPRDAIAVPYSDCLKLEHDARFTLVMHTQNLANIPHKA